MNRAAAALFTCRIIHLMFALSVLLCGPHVFSQTVPGAVALPEAINGTRVLSADTIYQLSGTVKVMPGGLLSIPAGTLILGNAEVSRSCLQIENGGKIYARGTAECPIIFTSAKPQGSKQPGDWGGIIILGNAVINATGGTATIEGGTGGAFGGIDNSDSSGVLSFVRIEYGGIAFSSAGADRINGLTLAGVGNRTVINNIQVSYGNEDGFEWRGGAVNTTNLISFGNVDDDFQTGLGYTGRMQYLFAMRDSVRYDTTGRSNGMESENDATASARTPLTLPIVSNMTLAGPFRDENQPTGQFGSGGHWRDNSRYALFNSVLVGWQEGLRLDGAGIAATTPGCPQPANLRLGTTLVTGNTVVWGANGVSLVGLAFWFVCTGGGNQNPGNHPTGAIRAVTQTDLHVNDPRPTTISPAATGGSFTDALLGAGNNFSFSTPTYKGAFDPSLNRDRQWDSLWSNYDPDRTTYVKHRTGWNLVALANTPADPHVDSVYRSASSGMFRYSGLYQGRDTLEPGTGYWLKLADNCIIEQSGALLPLPRTVAVVAGWNLIASGGSAPAPVANITYTSTSAVTSYFGYNRGYSVATRIEPGKGYWVRMSAPGTITFNP